MGRSKYNSTERAEIGRRIADHELSSYEAAVEYNISVYTARDYMRMYKASKEAGAASIERVESAYKYMNRAQLIGELERVKHELARIKGAEN